MRIVKIAWKFSVPGTYLCELCQTPLQASEIVSNPNHIYKWGQLMSCSCGTSKLWANSIRFPTSLANWCDNKEIPFSQDPTAWGFCNDEFCPICWKSWQCLHTGLLGPNGNYDLFGCPSCKDNQHAIVIGASKGLNDAQGQAYLANWYRKHQDLWRDKI